MFFQHDRCQSMTELNKEPPAVPSEKVGQINFGLEYDYQQNTLILRIIAVSRDTIECNIAREQKLITFRQYCFNEKTDCLSVTKLKRKFFWSTYIFLDTVQMLRTNITIRNSHVFGYNHSDLRDVYQKTAELAYRMYESYALNYHRIAESRNFVRISKRIKISVLEL